MNDSFDVLMKLILPESPEEYFELTSDKKKDEELHTTKFYVFLQMR